MKKHLQIILFTMVLLVTWSISHAQCTFHNPIVKPNFPDPWILQKDGWYYWCKQDGGCQITIERSQGLPGVTQTQGWTQVFDCNNNSAGIHGDVWAPEVHYLDGKWYIYASGTVNPNGFDLKLFVLESDTWNGTYTFKGLMETGGWSIDADVIDVNNKRYITWSQFEPEGQCIRIAELTNPWTMGSTKTKISHPDYDWEKQPGGNNPVNEGPEFIIKNSKIHISYSGSQCHSRYYKLGLLTANVTDNLLDANVWNKSSTPLFQETTGAWGPGHNCFIKSPDLSEDWIVYHAHTNQAWEDTGEHGDRAMFAQAFTWNGDYPVFGTPNASGTQNCPSNHTCTNQSITFNSITDKIVGDPDFSISASASSKLSVSLSVVSGPAAVTGSNVHLTGQAGKVVIKATQAGNDTYCAASDAQQTFNVIDPNAGDGLKGNYYQDSYTFNLSNWTPSSTETGAWNPPSSGISWFSAPKATRIDPTINVPKGGLDAFLSGLSGLNKTGAVSVRWTGSVKFPAAGTYKFYLSGADGLRLKINSTNTIGDFTTSDPSWVVRPYLDASTAYLPLSGTINVSQNMAGTKVPIQVEYYSVGVTSYSAIGDRGIILEWENTGGSISKQVVPQSQLFSTDITTGTVSALSGQTIEIYPNPAKEQFTVQCGLSIQTISITDLQGHPLNQYNESFTGSKNIDVQHLANGMYLLHLKGEGLDAIRKITISR